MCEYDCALPIYLKTVDGRVVQGTFHTPTIKGASPLPALLGLKTLRERRAIIDFRGLTMTLCGPDDRPLEYPTGSDTFQLEQAPSGHCMLPCCEYWFQPNSEESITLVNQPEATASSSSNTD